MISGKKKISEYNVAPFYDVVVRIQLNNKASRWTSYITPKNCARQKRKEE